LDGDPPVVLFGSPGWWPNRDGSRWFLEAAWPAVRRAHPAARLHLFGFGAEASPGVEQHPAPRSSADALHPGSILAVPLFVSSGVRMKILEAWARGVTVVASPAAARGLRFEDGRELAVADGVDGWVRAVGAAAASREARIEAGRRALGAHDPPVVAARLEEIYRRCLDGVAD
ncbi:MAG: glycosyltransferase family 4 protein, partial [Acidobacteriota bacterium]